MTLGFLNLIPKKALGIDIGTSFIKIVELSNIRDRKKLESYGALSASVLYKQNFRTFDKNSLVLSSEDIAKAIKAILDEANIKTKKAVFTIPDFHTFFTNIELPPMTKEEMLQAVNYEARKYIPVPLGEVTLDWEVIRGKVGSKEKEKLTVLLVAVTNEVVNQYQTIAKLAGLELIALEAEVFGLIRSLVPEDNQKNICLIDIGARSTSCNVVSRNLLEKSYSFDVSGDNLTEIVAKGLSNNYQKAEELKAQFGLLDRDLDFGEERSVKKVLMPLVDDILREVSKISGGFTQTEGSQVDKYIIAGGTALLPGIGDYFQEYLKKEVEIANPFKEIFCPPILEQELNKMGPTYAIALGAALRGIK